MGCRRIPLLLVVCSNSESIWHAMVKVVVFLPIFESSEPQQLPAFQPLRTPSSLALATSSSWFASILGFQFQKYNLQQVTQPDISLQISKTSRSDSLRSGLHKKADRTSAHNLLDAQFTGMQFQTNPATELTLVTSSTATALPPFSICFKSLLAWPWWSSTPGTSSDCLSLSSWNRSSVSHIQRILLANRTSIWRQWKRMIRRWMVSCRERHWFISSKVQQLVSV